MSKPVNRTRYEFPATRPELPPISKWSGTLEAAYEANWFTNFGAISRRLEDKIAAKWGFESTACVMTSSGTAAIAAPLIARNITGKVLVPAFTFPATVSAVKMAGAEPVIVDVDPARWALSPETMELALEATGAPAAILVKPFGMRLNADAHKRIARRRGAVLVIDNAAGLGVDRDEIEGDENCFEAYSLHATKPFGVGEGGVVFCPVSQEDAIRSALNFGLATLDQATGPFWGVNGKISELHAAVGLSVFENYDERLKLRRAFAARYIRVLTGAASVLFPTDLMASAWQVFPVLMPSETSALALIAHADDAGMEVRRYYRPSLSTINQVTRWEACPVSEDLSSRMCCLPVYSYLARGEASRMEEILTAALKTALDGR